MNPVIRKFLIWKNKLFFKQKSLSFATTFSQAQSMLVLLPHQEDNFSSVFNHLPPLETIFSDLKITFLLPFSTRGFVSDLRTYEVIVLIKENLGWSGLPKRDFIHRLRDYRFDVTLDMDLSKNFFNPYLGLLSNAKVRIGVKGGWGPPYYNLELIIPSQLLYLDEQYDSLIRTLKNLRMGKTVEA